MLLKRKSRREELGGTFFIISYYHKDYEGDGEGYEYGPHYQYSNNVEGILYEINGIYHGKDKYIYHDGRLFRKRYNFKFMGNGYSIVIDSKHYELNKE